MNKQDKIADIGFLLEGTYPYVMGGVSTWVDQIIRALPQFTFALFFIGSRKDMAQKLAYELPPNIIALEEIFLYERLPQEQIKPARTPAILKAQIYSKLKRFYLSDDTAEQMNLFWELVNLFLQSESRFTFGNLLRDKESWELLEDAYDKFCPDESFIDFFWTTRFLHLPPWKLLLGSKKVPQARVYHSASAGYAGLIGAMAARRFNVPFLLTEHGIYTKERVAEITNADWIYEGDLDELDFSEGMGKLKQLWIDLFKLQGLLAYDTADKIVTLYEGNILTQIEFGADRHKTMVIPNGIDTEKFNLIRETVRSRWNPEPQMKHIGFVGRVVPIKDVKTLLRAARLVCERCSDVDFLIAGPYSEDPSYFEECQKITKLLDLEGKVHFLGAQKLMEILPKMDVMVLTSISEGLPLVILEAMAGGIPIVASDVGACRELVFGRTPEDKALGRCGRLTKIMSPEETANGLISLIRNPAAWRQASEAGTERARQFYSMESLIRDYSYLYLECLNRGRFQSGERAMAQLEPVS